MTLTNYLRSGVAALAMAAVVPAFAQQAPSPSQVHPLLTSSNSVGYSAALSTAVYGITKVSDDRLRVGGFVLELEKALKETRDKPRTVIYPKDAIIGQLSIVAIVPPTGMESTPIGVCLQQGLKVPGKEDLVHTNLGTLQIQPNGTVVSQVWNGAKVGGNDATGKFQAACAPYRAAYIQYVNDTRMAQTPVIPTPPAPPTVATVAGLGPSRTVAQAVTAAPTAP